MLSRAPGSTVPSTATVSRYPATASTATTASTTEPPISRSMSYSRYRSTAKPVATGTPR